MTPPNKVSARHIRQCACLRSKKARHAKKHGFEVSRWNPDTERWVRVASVKFFERLVREAAPFETVLVRCLQCGFELLREHPPAKKETNMKLTLNLIETGEGWVWDLCDETEPLKPVAICTSIPKLAKPTIDELKAHLVEVLQAIQSDNFAVYSITTKGRTRVTG